MASQFDASKPFSQAEIDKVVGSESSFAFECQVHHRLRNWFINAQHGGTYIDPATKLHREFDIRVSAQTTAGNHINLAIECKKISQATPVVVLQSLRKHNERSVSEIVPMVTTNPHSARMPKTKDGFRRYSGNFVGRSIEQYQRDKKIGCKKVRNADGIYAKWSQAISSCYEFVENGVGLHGAFRTLVIPVLVVPNSCLWLIDFDRGGVASPARQASHCEVYVNVPVGDKGFRITHLEIWTFDAIEERVTSLEP